VEHEAANCPTLTAHQIEQLLKLLPTNNTNSTTYYGGNKFQLKTDEEIDVNFAGKENILSTKTSNTAGYWIQVQQTILQ